MTLYVIFTENTPEYAEKICLIYTEVLGTFACKNRPQMLDWTAVITLKTKTLKAKV